MLDFKQLDRDPLGAYLNPLFFPMFNRFLRGKSLKRAGGSGLAGPGSEAETLAANNQSDRAWNTLQQALKQYPDDLNLLYSRAMLAEKRNDLDQMERDLRAIIKREPDNAMALNALGYTLSDRTTRYTEAKALIQQAYDLNPDDPAVLDSLGWVNYRLGNLDEAERLLRQALERFPDQEVAAHLGEVLWANGKQREAKTIWGTFLKENPDSPILRKTILRLTGSETL